MSKKKNEIIDVTIESLIPDTKNANKGNEYGEGLIEKSFRKFGAGRSILIDKDNNVIAGNKSLQKFSEIGLTNVRIIETDGTELIAVKRTDISIDSKKGRELAIADNASAKANITWDVDAVGDLKDEFEIDMSEWGIDFGEEVLEAQDDDFDAPPIDEIKTDIVLGDIFDIGSHRLICADSTDSDAIAKLMKGELADMIFTDPPYGVDYKGINNDNRSGLKELLNGAFENYILNSKSGASVYCFHSDKCSDIFNEVFRFFCHFSSMIIWVKESIVLSQTDYQSKHEPCFYGWFDNGTHKWYSDRKQESVWVAKSKREEGHTTPKPIEIVSKAIANSSEINHLIFDLFLGSGSTMVASHQLNRRCFGSEIDTKYCEVIVQRMIKLDKELTIKRNGIDETDKWLSKLVTV